jgi:penicillin-binding protein 1A
MERQRSVLDRMIEFGYTTRQEADRSFKEYWENYDYTRASTAAYYDREDKAPWFSEYVRREMENMQYGTMDYYRDGLTVHTTLNLNHQQAAEKFMTEGIVKANKEFSSSHEARLEKAEQTYIPVIDMLSLFFGFEDIHTASYAQNEQKAISRYVKTINPMVDMLTLAFGLQDLKPLITSGYDELKNATEQNVVEGALISIENETGFITAIVGGSKFDETNQLIRATQSRVMPGSSFKPLYYSAAIDSRKFNPASLLYDIPIVFHNEDGTPYIPLNFKGEWKGSVLLYYALAHSMNVPSLKILDGIGFDAAIDRAAALLDITDPDEKQRTFPRVYPMGLGIISVSPVKMARAFAVFGNQGRDVTPIAIRSVEDRNGRIVLDPERELRLKQQNLGNNIQVISPQNAYVMTSILKKTVEIGTLAYGVNWGSKMTFLDDKGKKFRMPSAGKTGTTQNWSDAWAVGYTPYYTTAIWFGFDKPGNSLGLNLTGATLAGPIWGDYMREIHQGLPMKDFARPASGIIDVTVCAKSGLLKTDACDEGEVTLPFLTGTQPTEYCNIHGNRDFGTGVNFETTRFSSLDLDEDILLSDLTMPSLNLNLLPPGRTPQVSSSGGVSPENTALSSVQTDRTGSGASGSLYYNNGAPDDAEGIYDNPFLSNTGNGDGMGEAFEEAYKDGEDIPYNPFLY